MKTTMNADQAKKLALLVATVRPSWAVTAITNALWDVRTKPLHKVAAAALRAAADPDCHSPASIAWLDKPHWQPEPLTHDEIPAWRDPDADVKPADPEFIANLRRKDQP